MISRGNKQHEVVTQQYSTQFIVVSSAAKTHSKASEPITPLRYTDISVTKHLPSSVHNTQLS